MPAELDAVRSVEDDWEGDSPAEAGCVAPGADSVNQTSAGLSVVLHPAMPRQSATIADRPVALFHPLVSAAVKPCFLLAGCGVRPDRSSIHDQDRDNPQRLVTIPRGMRARSTDRIALFAATVNSAGMTYCYTRSLT